MSETVDLHDGNAILEADTWKDLITSDNWSYFKDLMRAHRNHLNKQALLKLDSKEYESALVFRTRAIECDAILQLVEGRLAEILKQ